MRILIVFLVFITSTLFSFITVYGATKEQLSELIDGLNDPDPIIRLVTFEEAVSSGDATLKRVAMRTAIQSSDTDLRAVALRGAFTGVEIVSFSLSLSNKVEAAWEATNGDQKAINKFIDYFGYPIDFTNKYSHHLIILVEKYDYPTGNFEGYCMNNKSKKDDNYLVKGSVSGSELTLHSYCNVRLYYQGTLKVKLSNEGTLSGVFANERGGSVNAHLDLL